PAAAETESVPQDSVPASVLVPLTVSVHVPGQYTDPRSQCSAAVPLIAIWPVLLAGAQIKRFQQARSPLGHHVEPGQLASPAGACEHGAANQVYPPPAESATALGGHAEIEHGVDPNWQVAAAQFAPPPAAHVPVERPAWLTNSIVTSWASSMPPFRQMPPPPAKPEPLKL